MKRRICAQLFASVGLCLLDPVEASACNACVNITAAYRFPFVGKLLVLFAVWLIVSLLFSPSRTGSNTADGSMDSGERKTLKRFPVWGSLAMLLAMIYILWVPVGLLLILIWVSYLGTNLIFKRSRARGRFWGNAQLLFNLAALVTVTVVIPVSVVEARTTESMVGWLGGLPSHIRVASRDLIPELIARGEEAVPELHAALQKELTQLDEPHTERVAQILYCLGQIGGDRAEMVLKEVVTGDRIFQKDADWRWGSVACTAYADCANERAVDPLKELYRRCESEDAGIQSAMALCALPRTGQREGVFFVLDHIDELQVNDNDRQSYYAPAVRIKLLTRHVLLEEVNREAVEAKDIYAVWRFGIDLIPPEEKSLSIDWKAIHERDITEDEVKEARQRWREIL